MTGVGLATALVVSVVLTSVGAPLAFATAEGTDGADSTAPVDVPAHPLIASIGVCLFFSGWFVCV